MSRRVKVLGDLYHGVVPDGAVYVGRQAPGLPRSPFANPHAVGKPCRACGGTVHSRAEAVAAYRDDLGPELVAQAREEIGERDVACWCRLDQACHGDVLLDAIRPDLAGEPGGRRPVDAGPSGGPLSGTRP